jgi:hypothetical protein
LPADRRTIGCRLLSSRKENRPVVLAVTVEIEAEQIADALVATSESIRIREVFESRES